MAGMFDDLEGGVSGGAAAGGLFDDLETKPATSGITRRLVGDTAITALKSAIAVPEIAVGIGDLVTGGRAGKAAEQAGFRPKEAKAFLDDYLSPEQKAANEKLAQADGFVDMLSTAADNPSTILHTGLESIAPMLAGGVVARGLMAAPAVAGKLAPWAAGAIGEGVVGAGMGAESIRQQTEDGLLTGEQAGLAGLSGLGTGLIGAGGAKIAQKLGIGEIDTLLAGGNAGAATTKGVARKVAEGAAVEGVFQELPQSAQEQALQNIALGKPWNEGLGNAAAMGLLTGAALGGIAGPLGGKALVQPTPTAENPASAPVPAPDPAAGPISRTAAQLPGPSIAGLLPDPGQTLYGDAAGNLSPDGPPRNVDREYRPTGRERGPQTFGPGMDQSVPMGEQAPLEGQLIRGGIGAQSQAAPRTPETYDNEQSLGLPAPSRAIPDMRGDNITVAPDDTAVPGKTPSTPPAPYIQGGRGMDQQAPIGQRFSNQLAAKNAISKAPEPVALEVVEVGPKQFEVQVKAPVLQNRDRSTPASITQMRSIAANPDYSRLGFSRDFANGAPVVEPDANVLPQALGRQDVATTGSGRKIPVQYAVVEAASLMPSHDVNGSPDEQYAMGAKGKSRAIAGNGRVAGLRHAFTQGTAGQYVEQMTDDASLHGISPAVIRGMKEPVLVRIMPREEITQDIGDESNTTGVSALSGAEQAMNDARRISIDDMEFSESGEISETTVRQFVQSMPAAERNNLLDGSRLSRQAYDRAESAIFANAYESEALIRLQAQATDPEVRTALSGLLVAAPKMARLKGAGAWDIRGLVVEAAEAAVNARRSGQTLEQFAQQIDLDRDPESQHFVELFAANIRSAKRIGEELSNIAELFYAESSKPEFDMFGAVPRRSRQELLNGATNADTTSQSGSAQAAGNQARPGAAAPGREGGETERVEPAGDRPNPQPAEDFQLNTYSEEELAVQAAAQAEAAAQAASDAKAEADKAQADRDRNDFTLSGSDRPSDVAAARGQNDMFAPPTMGEKKAGAMSEQAKAEAVRTDGSTETLDGGMTIVHGSGNDSLKAEDIQIVRASGQKQGKKGRVYGGFYGTSEADADQAEGYAGMMGGTPTLYDVKIKPGTKVLNKTGDVTRLSEAYINELVSQGYGLVTGTDPRGRTEHVVIDKNAIQEIGVRSRAQLAATPSSSQAVNGLIEGRRTDAPTVQEVESKQADEYAARLRKLGDEFQGSYSGRSLAPLARAMADHAIEQGRRLTDAEIADMGKRFDVPADVVGQLTGNIFTFDAILGDAQRRDPGAVALRKRQSQAGTKKAQQEQAPASPKASKIEDVGDQLKFNKKGMFRSGGLKWSDIASENDALKVKLAGKEKIWARPNWEQIIEAQPADQRDGFRMAAHLVKQVYDALPKQAPVKTDEGIQQYIEAVTELRAAAEAFLGDGDALAGVLSGLSQKAANRMSRSFSILDMQANNKISTAPLFAALFPEQAAGKRFERGTPANTKGQMIGSKAIKAMQWGADDAVKAMKAIKAGWPAKQEAWEKQGYAVHLLDSAMTGRYFGMDDGKIAAHLLLGGRSVDELGIFDTRTKAEAAVEAKSKELVGQFLVLDKRKRMLGAFLTEAEATDFARAQVARKAEPEQQTAEQASEEWDARTGEPRRPDNKDVSPEDLIEAFGFRGVNFGNWVKQGERRRHLNAAYDAFADLAELLGIPPKAVSLNGMLGVAFGAQGGGKFAAHFVPGVNEINITKTRGAGSLAHEWAHALDHYFGTQAGLARSANPFASTLQGMSKYARGKLENVQLRPEIEQAFNNIVDVMRSRVETPAEVVKRRQDALQKAKESAQVVADRLRPRLEGNAEALKALDAVMEGEAGEYVNLPIPKGKRKPIGAIPENIKTVYDALGYSSQEAYDKSYQLHRVALAKEQLSMDVMARSVHTQFYRNSMVLDGKKTPYWSTQWEMFARGFESWVMDALALRGAANNYLVGEGKADEALLDDSPYPRGSERALLNDAFGKLAAEIKFRQADDGNVPLYRLSDTSAKGIPLFSARAIAKKVMAATGLNATVVNTEADLPADLQAQIKRDKAIGRVAGVYHNGTAYLVAANLRDTKHAISVMLHEAIGHGGVKSVLGDRIGKVMAEIYRDMPAAMRKELERRYAGQMASMSEADARVMIAEEYVAHLAETDPRHSIINRLVALLRQFIRDTFGKSAALKWTRNDLVLLLAEARTAARNGGRGPGGAARMRETAAADALAALPEVDAADESAFVASLKGDAATRSFANALYKARGTESPFFKAWFGKSRMVDKQGQPIAFVHRSYGERDTFTDADLGKNTGTPTASLGHFLARKDVGNVERYGPVVEQFYIRMEKPKVITQAQFEAMGDWSLAKVQAYRKTLMDQGHDGLYIQGLSWPVVFEGKNIKAKRNQGTFDATASTRYSLAQTATAAFKRWFGDSKVVDENGSPRVVYHGTAADFDAFAPSKAKDKEGRRMGLGWGKGKFYFAETGEAASSSASFAQATGRGKQQNVMPVYLAVQKPMAAADYMAMVQAEVEKGKARDQAIAAVDRAIRRDGYDGIIDSESGGIAVFSPEQIKSAIGNNGDFDPANADIRYSLNDDIRDLFDRATGPTPLDRNDPFAEENRRLRENEKTLWNKAKKVFARQFAPGGLLPESVFNEKITRDSEFQVVEFDVRHLSSALGKAVKADFGVEIDSLTAEQMKPLAEALAGKVDPTIPEATKVAIVAMRQYIDSLSGEYLEIIQGQIDALQEKAATYGPALKAANDARKAFNAAIASDSDPAIMQALAGKKAALAAQVKAKKAMDGLKGEERAQAKAAYEVAVKAHDQAKAALRASLSPELKAQAKAAEALRAEANAARSSSAEAKAESALHDKISANLGAYVNRSYQAFDDPKWFKKVPTEVVNAARTYLARGYMAQGETAAEARRLADVTVNEILKNGTAYDSMGAFIAEGKLGAKDLTVLIKRKEIAPEIRALLGEYLDPRLNFAKSATKMGRLVWNQRFLDRVLEFGMGTLFFEGKNRPAEATTQIAGEQSEAYAPLNGLWTTPEIAQAFKDALGKEQMSDLYRTVVRLNGMVKYGKTVLSPTTAMRNWQSAMFFSLANGHFDLTQMKKSWAAFREQVTQNATGDDLAYLRKLKKLGVVYDTPYAGEMMALLQDARMDELLSSKSGKGIKWLRKANQLAQGFYSFGDDFWKIIGFENEKASLMDAGIPEAEAEVMAAKRIRDTYPTYSMIGRGIQWLRRFPLAGTFVSFPSEIIRTTVNMFQLVSADLKSDNPKIRALGRKRALGMMMVSGGFYALAALSAAAAGVDDDEEEALRDLAAPWSKNSTFLYTGRDEDGKLRYFDMSFLDPYGYWKRPLTAMMRDQPWEQAAASGLSDMLSPFFGADITAGAIFEVLSNKKPTGGTVFNPDAGSVDQLQDIANHMRKALQPGFVSNGERLWLAGTEARREGSGQPYVMRDELVSLLGWRASTLDTQTGLYYRSFDFTDGLANAKKTLTRTLRSSNDVSDDDIREAKESANAQYQRAFTEMGRLVRSAQSAGMSRAEVVQTLRLSGVAQRNIFALMNGRVPPIDIGIQAQTKAVQQAVVMRDREHGAEIARRFRLAREE